MAITKATTLSNFTGFMNPEMASYIFEKTAAESVVQKLARKVSLGNGGTAVPVVTKKLEAGWVAEATAKPVTEAGLGLKTMEPKKIAAIAVVSKEVARANPGKIMDHVKDQFAEAFARAFDTAVLQNAANPFGASLDSAEAIEFTGTKPKATALYDDLNGALKKLLDAGKTPDKWLFDRRFEPTLNLEKDTAGRPLFIDPTYTEKSGAIRQGSLLGYSATFAPNVAATGETYGFLGDWSQIVWGQLGSISYKVSGEAAVTIGGQLVSLYENNLVAILAETEYGLLVNDLSAFVKLVNKA